MAIPENAVRQAVPGDAPAVAQIWSEGWADGHRGHVPDELYAFRTSGSYLPRAEERIDETLVAEVDGRITGFTVVVGDELEQIYVDREARGTGTALALLREAEERIRRAGHAQAWLAVVDGNARAKAFYERAGWVEAGAIRYAAEAGDATVDVPARRYVRDVG